LYFHDDLIIEIEEEYQFPEEEYEEIRSYQCRSSITLYVGVEL